MRIGDRPWRVSLVTDANVRDVPIENAKVGLRAGTQTDVCLIVEGCYPYIAGGVSSWVDWLMRTQRDLTFSVVAITSGHEERRKRYECPPNLLVQHDLVLNANVARKQLRLRRARVGQHLSQVLSTFMDRGGLSQFRELVGIANDNGRGVSLYDLLESPEAFGIVRGMYEALMPHASFLQFYWAWRALCGGLFATLKLELPDARVYHTISTGYAGLLAARAAIETGRPAVITEHGIYTNERRIEILMADWISDTVDKGLNVDDPRRDLRDLWISVFESYARTCYEACSQITTLYRDNQALQISLGAEIGKLKVIANGIDVRALCRPRRCPASCAANHRTDRTCRTDQGYEDLHCGRGSSLAGGAGPPGPGHGADGRGTRLRRRVPAARSGTRPG